MEFLATQEMVQECLAHVIWVRRRIDGDLVECTCGWSGSLDFTQPAGDGLSDVFSDHERFLIAGSPAVRLFYPRVTLVHDDGWYRLPDEVLIWLLEQPDVLEQVRAATESLLTMRANEPEMRHRFPAGAVFEATDVIGEAAPGFEVSMWLRELVHFEEIRELDSGDGHAPQRYDAI